MIEEGHNSYVSDFVAVASSRSSVGRFRDAWVSGLQDVPCSGVIWV